MKTLATLFLLTIRTLTFSQHIFTVDDFSKDYYGKISIEDTSEAFSKGWIAIYEKKTNKELIKVTSDELAPSLTNGQLKSNMRKLYNEQSLIIYNDFNFDGINDFAIEDGQNSCYHGPSFQIYLGHLGRTNEFTYNEDFTRLAQDYCGMFEVNRKEKKINTMTKSGCCWHQYSEFIIENNKPKAVKILEEDLTSKFPYSFITKQIWNGKKMIKTTEKKINLNELGIKPILSFILKKENKKITLFSTDDNILNYVIEKEDGTIEFNYPLEDNREDSNFTIDNSTKEQLNIIFKNNSTTYTIYETSDTKKVGIIVNTGGKTYYVEGEPTSKKGSLKEVFKTTLDNVTIK